MATKVQDAIIAMANGVINYVDVRIDNANYVRTDIGKVKSVALVNGKYSHTVTIRNYDYSGVFSLGNNEFSANSVVYLLIPSGQYNQMFILGHLDDTLAHIKGGDINLGNGNFVVDNNGNVTIKKGSINLGNGNFTVDNNGSVVIKSGNITLNSGSINLGNNFIVDSSGVVTIKSGSINLGNGNFVVNSSGVITVKTGSINLGNGNFVVDNSGSVTIKSGSINLGNNFVVTSAGSVTIKNGSINLGNGNFTVDSNGYLTFNASRIGNFYIGSDGNFWYYGSAVNHYEIGKISGQSGGNWGSSGLFEIGSPVGGLRLYGSGVYGASLICELNGPCSMSSTNASIILNQTSDTLGTIRISGTNAIYLNGTTLSSNGRKFTFNSTNAIIESVETQKLYIRSSAESDYGVQVAVVDSMWTFAPIANQYMRLGSPSYKWNQIYSNNATINTSDRNEKYDIETLNDKNTKDFIMALNPVSFKFKNGESGRTHHGLIAQDVEDTLYKLNISSMDFAGFCKDQKMREIKKPELDENGNEVLDRDGNVVMIDSQEPIENEYTYGLRYEEFIPSLIKMVQMLQTEIEELKNKIGE